MKRDYRLSCTQFALRRFLFLVLSGLIILTAAQPLWCQQSETVRLDGTRIEPSTIDSTVAKLMERNRVTGAGIAIFNGGRIVFMRSYGLRDKDRKLPLTPDSVMTAASLTKSAFATMVMQLEREGIVDLDKPVFEYLPKPLPEYSEYHDLAKVVPWVSLVVCPSCG